MDSSSQRQENSRRLPLRIAGLFLSLAVTWVVVSAGLVEAWAPDAGTLSRWRIAKDLVFMGLVSAWLYWLVGRCLPRQATGPTDLPRPATGADGPALASGEPRALAQLDRINRLYSVLSEANQAIVRLRDRDELFAAICRILVEQGPFRMAWIGAVNAAAGVIEPVCSWGHVDGYLDDFRIPLDGDNPLARGPVGRAAITGQYQLFSDSQTDPEMAPWRTAALQRGYRSVAAFPITERGAVRWVLAIYAGEAVLFDQPYIELLEGLSTDVAFALSVIGQEHQRRQAELALAEEKERLVVTLQSIGDGVITTDTGGHVVLMNQVAEQLTGWTQGEACGQPLSEILRPVGDQARDATVGTLAQVLKRNAPVESASHVALVARDGTERLIAESGSPIRNVAGAVIGVVLVLRDVSEKVKLEDELLKTRKLESLGVLAGGIAHDFNNLLTAILGSVSLARAFHGEGERGLRRLDEAEKACLQARELTQQLLTFAKGGVPVKRTAAIAEIVAETAGFATVGGRSRSVLDLAPGLHTVEVDVGQIGQVFNNLIINAVQAMPDGGVVTIRGANLDVGADLPLPLPAGPYVRIDVCDNGVGIPTDDLPRIFDPYFTTKAEGSGLGLASAYAIIKKHDGYIDVDSTPGAGTTVMVYLPASLNERQIEPPVDDNLTAGRGSVLVMDDAQSIRDLLGEMLDYLGYRVSFARDGDEARHAYAQAQADGRPFDAVIMDLTIPGGMGGKEAITHLLALDPQARVIVSSGYSNDPIMSNYREYGFSAVIAKPYRLAELGKVLDGVLAAQS